MPSEDKFIKNKERPFTSPSKFNKITEGTSMEAEEIYAAFTNLIDTLDSFRENKFKLNPTDKQHLHNLTFGALIPAVRFLLRGGVYESLTSEEIKEVVRKALSKARIK